MKSLSLGLKETYSPDNVEASLGVMRRILACFASCRLPYPAPSTWPFYLSCASLHSRQASTIVFFIFSKQFTKYLTLYPRLEDLAAAQECLERAEALFLQCRDETHRDHDKIKRFRAALALKLASTPQESGEN